MAEFYRLELVNNRPICKKIGNTGCPSDFGRIQSMTFDRNTGDLYWANCFVYNTTQSDDWLSHDLIQVNLNDGTGTVLGPIGGAETVGLYIPYDRAVPDKQIERIVLPETGWQYQGKTQQLQVAVVPATAADQRLIWSSSDTTVATVNEDGVITAKSAGVSTITVTSVARPEVSASCEFTVLPFDGKTMCGFLSDTGNGTPGWIRFNAATPETFTVLREEPGLYITGADWGKNVVYASGYTDDDRTESLFCLNPDTLEVQERIHTFMPTADIVYSGIHNMILFVYKTYFGFILLKETNIEGSTYRAGTALYFDLTKLVGDDYITGITDLPYGDDDTSYNKIITSSGITYDVVLSDDFRLMALPDMDLVVEAFSEQGNSLVYSHSIASGNPVYYYNVYNETRQESTLHAITGDMYGMTQVLNLGSFGGGQAPLTGIFVDYPTEAGIRSGELPELTEETCLLTMEASELQVYQPPVSQDTQP